MTAHVDERLSRAQASGPEGSRAPRAEFVVVTNDDALLEQVGPALDGESTVRHAETTAAALAFLRPAQPSVVLLDARGLAEPAAAIESLQSPDIACVVVVFAPADQCTDVARTIRGSAAFAVLPVPIEQAQAMAVIEGAREESLARHTLLSAPVADAPVAPAPAPIVNRIPARPAVQEVRPAPAAVEPNEFAAVVAGGRSGGGVSKLVVPGVVAIVLLAAAVAWFTLRERDVEVAPQAAPEAVATAAPAIVQVPAGTVDESLERARTAMRERRYTDPEGDSALHYYNSVLAQEPDNGEAREGLQRIAAVLHERAQAAFAEQRIDEAARTLGQLRAIRPDDPALAELDRKVTAAQAAAALAESEAARAEQLARLVSARIRAGKLLQPATDSAKHHLAQLQRMHGAPQLAEHATTELQQAYLKKYREAVAQGQRADAERWQAEARAIGVGATELAAVQREASSRSTVRQAQQETDKLAQLVQQRIDDGRLTEPAGDSALFHLNALKTRDPSSPAIASIERELSDRLLDQARAALANQQVYRAQANVAAARQLGLDPEGIAALERAISGASAPTAASKAAAPPPVELKRTRYVAPEYPKEALQAGLSGEVRVRITVRADGRVKDAAVERATPERVFDDAALAAARKWRFKPIGDDDSGREASAVATIVFKPQDAPSR